MVQQKRLIVQSIVPTNLLTWFRMIKNVSFIFTTVSIDYTIDLTLKQIYDDKEIETKIS